MMSKKQKKQKNYGQNVSLHLPSRKNGDLFFEENIDFLNTWEVLIINIPDECIPLEYKERILELRENYLSRLKEDVALLEKKKQSLEYNTKKYNTLYKNLQQKLQILGRFQDNINL